MSITERLKEAPYVPGLRPGPGRKDLVVVEGPFRPGGMAVEYKVIVFPDQSDEVTAGGLYKPEEVLKKEKHRTQKATVVSVGGNAFEEWAQPIPKVGDRVLVAVQAGVFMDGEDGREYRVVNDKDIIMIFDKKEEE